MDAREIGESAKARDYLEQALARYSALGNVIGQGNAAIALTNLCREIGDNEGAHDYARQALDLYEQAGSSHGQAIAHFGLAGLRMLGADLDGAKRHFALPCGSPLRAVCARPRQRHTWNSETWTTATASGSPRISLDTGTRHRPGDRRHRRAIDRA